MIIPFYRNEGADTEGRTLDEILSWDDRRLESIHNFIQWLFPLDEPSGANSSAPILTPDEIEKIRGDELIQKNLLRSYERMLHFYESDKQWLTPHNHNFLRITRILKSLTLLGQEKKDKVFFQFLDDLYHSTASSLIGTTSYRFWRNSLNKH